MTVPDMTSPWWTAAILALAIGVGTVRLWLWRWNAPRDQLGPAWRTGALFTLPPLAGLLLFLTLHAPGGGPGGGVMVVATRGTPAVAPAPNEVLVALPEAGDVTRGERVPDLATALRRHPDISRIQVLGEGLPPRDRIPLNIPVEAASAPRPRGLVEITLPKPVAPGEAFAVGGLVGALASGVVELVDPAGVVADRSPIVAGGRFVLKGAARTEGLAVFDLRLRDAAGRLVERLDVPLETRADPMPRVVALAGAPGPEINLLRRWARTAGVELAVGLNLGAGVEVGEGAPSLTRAALAETDLLVIDDRRWEALDPGARAAVAGAVEGGMGLLLRPTGPLTGGIRREWTILGAPVSGAGDSQPIALGGEDLPELARRELADPGDRAVSIISGPDGAPLASWRARGRGRIAVWTVVDSYVLVLAGRPDLHADLWSALFSELARPIGAGRPHLLDLARVGERAAICGLAPQSQVRTPSGRVADLTIDPAAGPEACAAYWPDEAGWSLVSAPGGASIPIHVHAAGAAPSMRGAQLLQNNPAVRRVAQGRSGPWNAHWAPVIALLSVLAALWIIERRRRSTPEETEA